jgi:hypothetical protein
LLDHAAPAVKTIGMVCVCCCKVLVASAGVPHWRVAQCQRLDCATSTGCWSPTPDTQASGHTSHHRDGIRHASSVVAAYAALVDQAELGQLGGNLRSERCCRCSRFTMVTSLGLFSTRRVLGVLDCLDARGG